MMYGMYGYGMNGIHGIGWGMGLVWILGILITVFLVWTIVSGFNTNHKSSTSGERKSALDILKERYARGEINKEEFDEKKHVLS